MLLVPLPYTIVSTFCIPPTAKENSFHQGIRYGIPNEILVGACFIPLGLGSMSTCILSFLTKSIHSLYYNLVGAPIAGIISDRTVIWWRNERKGTWYPEDRLRASLIPLTLMVPLPVIAFGFINKFVDGSLGLFTSLLCLFINGIVVSIHHRTRHSLRLN